MAPSLEPTKRYKTALKDKAFSPTEVETLLRHFDEGMDALSGQLHKFQLIHNFLSNLVQDSTSSVDVKLSEITDTIGKKPTMLDNNFDAPDLWGTISEIGSEFKEFSGSAFKDFSDISASVFTEKCSKVERKCQKLIKIASVDASVSHDKKVKPLQQSHETIKSFVKDVLSPRIIDDISRLDNLESNALNVNTAMTSAQTLTPSHEVSRLDNRMKAIEQEVSRNRKADGDAVVFFNLGFRSKQESDSWLTMNAPTDSFGYMVDFHTVM